MIKKQHTKSLHIIPLIAIITEWLMYFLTAEQWYYSKENSTQINHFTALNNLVVC